MGSSESRPAPRIQCDLTGYKAILIGCSINQGEGNGVRARSSCEGERQCNLNGVRKDLENMESFLLDVGILPADIKIIHPDGTRVNIKGELYAEFSENTKLIIYYSGHGRSDGAWCIENSSSRGIHYLSPHEFLGARTPTFFENRNLLPWATKDEWVHPWKIMKINQTI